ncbi:cupin domain-containing protein [Paraconexibacter sp.]|uniref:cupin domain-containing protein n=1 Tax=Paraconexibacter sp. TaxID=2949640 RepID=UPI0035643CDF
MSDYTITNLLEAKDSAPEYGIDALGQFIFPREELGATTTGLALQRLKPGKRQPFGHRHVDAEEIALVLAGSGRVKLDDEIRDLRTYDAIRIAPAVKRAFEAGPDGLELLVFGPRHEGDGELDHGFWTD